MEENDPKIIYTLNTYR